VQLANRPLRADGDGSPSWIRRGASTRSRSANGALTKRATTPSTPRSTGPGQGLRPGQGPGRVRPPERPYGRHLGPQRRQQRRSQAPANEVIRASSTSSCSSQGRARPAQPQGINWHPCLRRPRIRPFARAPFPATRPGATSTFAGSSTSSRSRSSRAPSGSCSSERHGALGARQTDHQQLPWSGLAGRSALRSHTARGLLREVRLRTNPPRLSTRASWWWRSASRRSSPLSSSSPDRPVLRGASLTE